MSETLTTTPPPQSSYFRALLLPLSSILAVFGSIYGLDMLEVHRLAQSRSLVGGSMVSLEDKKLTLQYVGGQYAVTLTNTKGLEMPEWGFEYAAEVDAAGKLTVCEVRNKMVCYDTAPDSDKELRARIMAQPTLGEIWADQERDQEAHTFKS